MQSIKAKMLLWFGLTLTVLLSLLAATTYWQAKDTVIALTRELSQEVLAARSAELSRLMQGYLSDVKTFASRNLIRRGDFVEIGMDLQKRANGINPDYEMLFFADAQGRFITTTGAMGDVSDRRYVKAIMEEGRAEFISEPVISRASGEYVFVVAAAVKNDEGRPIGLIGATVLLNTLSEIAGSITIGGNGFGWVADHNALVIAHPDPKMRMHLNLLRASERGFKGVEEIGRMVTEGRSGLRAFERPDGSQVVTIFNPIPNTPGWAIGVSLYETELMGRAYHLMRNIILLMVGILLAVLLMVGFISGRIAKPVLDLKKGVEVVASGNLDHVLDIRTGDEIEALSGAFNQMTGDLKEYIRNLQQVTADKERVEGELRVANKIQASMLPRVFPPFPDVERLDLYAVMEPAREVGGDFYDFFLLDDQRLYFSIGDVSGKGVPAALFMVITMTILRNQMVQGGSLEQVFHQTNNMLCSENVENMFVTVFTGLLDIRTGEMEFVSAGHNPPVVSRQSGDFSTLDAPVNLVLGGMEDYVFRSSRTILEPGDLLFLYTDGVTEAMNEKGELFSDARMIEAVNGLKGVGVRSLIKGMREAVGRFVQDEPASDDVTMMALTIKAG